MAGQQSRTADNRGSRFDDPTDIDDDVWQNEGLRSKMQITCSDSTCTFSTNATVAIGSDVTPAYAKAYLKQAETNWTATGQTDGVTYASRLSLTALYRGSEGYEEADLKMVSGNIAEAVRGGNTIYVIRGGDPLRIIDGQGGHEMGHIFGLGHQPNASQSIMSYDMDVRRVIPQDIKKIVDSYRGAR